MKKTLLLFSLLLLWPMLLSAEYTDHRGYNLDSLERVVAGWTPERLASASEEESSSVMTAYTGLMWGYNRLNTERSMYYARKGLDLARSRDYLYRMVECSRLVGQCHYGKGQLDSAMFYFREAEKAIPRMEGRYEQEQIDDLYSSLYGAMGNLYNVMDSIPQAMEYYSRAGEIFEKYGWLESCSILYHNMGETWLDEGNLQEAEICYNKALQFGLETGDSLMIADARAGLGALFLEKGKTRTALQYLHLADEYFSTHQDQEYSSRIYTLDLTGKVLDAQKRMLSYLVAGGILLIVLLLGLVFILWRSYRLRKEKEGADEVIDQALEDVDEGRVREGFTEREMQVLPLIARGLTSPQIADKLCLSLPTIKWYRKRLLQKLGAKNTVEMLAKAQEQGLLS